MASYRERTEGTITHTKLEDFAYCQMLYKLRWIEGLDFGEDGEEEDSEALVIGSAFDLYMQSVDRFNETYEIVARRTGKSGKIELTTEQGKLIRKMALEMSRQPYYNSIGEKQYHVKVIYNDAITISGTLDEFQKSNGTIIDDKTSANLRKFREFSEKYRRQIAFYQFLVYMTLGIVCDGLIRMVTKEKVSKAHFFYSDSETLSREWDRFKILLDELTEATRTGIFLPQPREKCLNCPAYAHCGHSIQKELYIL